MKPSKKGQQQQNPPINGQTAGGDQNDSLADPYQTNENSDQDQRALAEKRIQEEIAKGSQRLVLENFKLQDLIFLAGTVWDNLYEIDLHKNFLSSIDILNQFRNLRTIKASDNYIQEINLNLQKLEDLDLHNNYINKFPLLHSLPKIQKINLNSNKIADFRVEFKPPSSISLQYLDIGSNLIEFASNYEFYDFLEKIKKLKNLKAFIVTNNPFADEKKFDQIVSQMPSLEMFNYEKADEYRKQVMEEDKKGGKEGKGGRMDRGKTTKEAANSHPTYALDHLKDLAQDVDKITEHLEMIDEYIAKGKNEIEINSQLLIDNHFELQTIMLTILSKLSIIKYYDFGVRCFNTLKDLMVAGREMEERVISILEKEVINKLKQQNPEMIPASLLKGLYELVKLTGKAEMLTGLYENCFPQWLRTLVDKINACKRIGIVFENNEHFDNILALMAESLKNCKQNVLMAVKKDLIGFIAEILGKFYFAQTCR